MNLGNFFTQAVAKEKKRKDKLEEKEKRKEYINKSKKKKREELWDDPEKASHEIKFCIANSIGYNDGDDLFSHPGDLHPEFIWR